MVQSQGILGKQERIYAAITQYENGEDSLKWMMWGYAGSPIFGHLPKNICEHAAPVQLAFFKRCPLGSAGALYQKQGT